MKYIYRTLLVILGIGVAVLFLLTKSNPDFNLMWSILFWMLVAPIVVYAFFEAFDKPYLGLWKTWYAFNFQGEFRDPRHKDGYKVLMKRLELLEDQPSSSRWKRHKKNFEVKLLEEILHEAGYYKVKSHGKFNHKITWKYKLKGEKFRIKGHHK